MDAQNPVSFLRLTKKDVPRFIVYTNETGIHKVYQIVTGASKLGLALQAVPEPLSSILLRQLSGYR